ncbi:MAG TPA: DUF4382 domain-containing protein, partial [Terriglobia bacterium]|nr:DUF4382 domain-containing protein [Terriglobia bacterium]
MKILAVVLVGGMMIALTGCSKSGSPTSNGNGSMEVNMVDSPASYDQVNIVINSVEAHTAGSDSTNGWVTLNSTPGSYNLLAYTNGNFAVIGNAQIPSGHYTQIRLKLGTGSNVVVNGQTHPLNVASGFQTGVKLNVDANVQANTAYTLSLDFDANRSVIQSGDSARASYSLVPVIRASATATSGFIAGIVLPVTAKATVWAYSSTGDTLSTNVNVTGAFELMYAPQGS